MPELMNNECLVRCKYCDTVVTATWNSGVFKRGWRLKESKGNCPMCHKPVKLKRLETTKCPHCNKLVERTPDNRCLNCHKTLQQLAMRGQVECPECGMLVSIPADSRGDCICAVCGTVLPAAMIELKLGQAAVEREQYIRLPDVARMLQEDRAIWKHPQTSFPFKSRMQVNEGTYALFLQNGSCKEPCEPGSYLLEDSDLEKSQKFDAALEDSPVTFNTDIYCVLQDLPEMNWGLAVDQFQNRERTAAYNAGSNGRIALQVCDAKAYARYLGFKPVSISSLVRANPEPGSPDGTLLQAARGMLSEAMYACLNGMDDESLDRIVPNDVRDRLEMELNRLLAQYGLCVKTLWINALSVAKSGSAVAADQIRVWVQSEFSWSVKGARLYSYGDRTLYADLDFDGGFRLRVADDSRFYSISEIHAFTNDRQVKETDVKDYIQRKVQDKLKNALVIAAQEQIDRGSITDILDRNQYVFALKDRVRDRVNEELAPDGLTLSVFSVNMPTNIVKSNELAAYLDKPQRQQAIRRAVESTLRLRTDPIRAHLRDDKSVYVDLTFRGLCNLRVRDEDAFFRLSEVQGFITANRSLSESAVSDYYAHKINSVFKEVLSRITQGIVDQTNADVREINRFTAVLKDNVCVNMAPRIEAWGLELESLDLDGIDTVAASPNLDRQSALEETRSGVKLDEEIQRIQNDHVVFVMEEDGRVNVRGLDIKDGTEAKSDEIALRKLERQHQRKIAELQKGAELDRLVDDIAEGKRERADVSALEEYKRKFRIREEQLNQEIREARIVQQAQIDEQQRKLQVEFENKLNEAENQRALNDIMRKIAESDLNWQQKLDEYDRLRRRVTAETQVDIRKLEADADLKILRDKDDFYFESGTRKIRLNAEEAELLERINRYAEERRERETQAEESRLERRATLDFERRIQDRREQVAQQIDQLKLQYDHELAMRDRELDLQKLIAELQYHTSAVAQEADVKKAQASADANARIAEAQAAAKRLEEQLSREEKLAGRAEEFRKALMEIQTALELTRLGNDRNRDDRAAEIAIATANAADKSSGRSVGMTDKEYDRFRDLEKKVDRIVGSVKELRGQLRELKKLIPAGGWPHRPVDPWSPQPYYDSTPARGQSDAANPATTQPGTTDTRRCPICGQFINVNATICPVCSTPIL